jgi:hypothetical protein
MSLRVPAAMSIRRRFSMWWIIHGGVERGGGFRSEDNWPPAAVQFSSMTWEGLRGGFGLRLSMDHLYVDDFDFNRFPCCRALRMITTVWKGRTFPNDDFRSTTSTPIDSPLRIQLAIARHRRITP